MSSEPGRTWRISQLEGKMMSDIQEKVALAICKDLWAKGLIDMESPPEAFLIPAYVTADAAITAFLEAAADKGWHMRPDEAAEEMVTAGHGWCWLDGAPKCWRDMGKAAPPFEWRK